MIFQHVPFGLRKFDQAFVDVADVPRGKKCECICPSCHTPLIARQGKEKQWHFAHASRNVEGTDKECDFSFFVSVRMMARQVIETGIALDLPEYNCSITQQGKGTSFRENFLVTKASTVTLQNVHKEVSFENCTVDVVGEVNSFSFIIYFTHPSRPLPNDLHSPHHKQNGVLEIKLNDTYHLFSGEKDSNIRHLDKLKSFLQHDLESKCWIFHPRRAKLEQEATKRLNEKIAQYQPTLSSQQNLKKVDSFPISHSTGPISPKKRTALFECILCGCKWQVSLPGEVKCPKCKNNHLFANEISGSNTTG